jgi:hypothetical protein
MKVAVRAVEMGNCPSRCFTMAGRHPQGAIAKQKEFSPSRVMVVLVGFHDQNVICVMAIGSIRRVKVPGE